MVSEARMNSCSHSSLGGLQPTSPTQSPYTGIRVCRECGKEYTVTFEKVKYERHLTDPDELPSEPIVNEEWIVTQIKPR
jgi:hypothetical protein